MPKSYSFFGGELNPAGITAGLQGTVQAESQAAALRASGYQDISRSLLRGLELAQERRQRELEAERERQFAREQHATQLRQQGELQKRSQEFQAGEAQLDRVTRAREFEANVREGRLQAQASLIERLGASGMAAGLAPGPTFERATQLQGQLFGGTPTTPPAPAMPRGAEAGRLTGGVTGGLIGPAGYMPPGQETGFSGIPMVPQPPSEGDLKRADADEVAAVKRELEQFILSPEGQKALLAQKVTRLEAHGWQQRDPKALEALALKEYPSYAPTLGLDGEQDRSGVDELLRWLKEPQEVHVVTGAAVAQMRNGLWGRYSPRAIDQALTERFGNETATTQAQIKEVARAKLLQEMQEQKAAGSRASVGVQASSLSDLVSGAQERQETAQLGSGQGGPMQLNRAALEGMGLDFDQLGRSMQSAAALPGFQLALDPTGRVVVQTQTQGMAVPPGLQAEVDALFNDPGREGFQRGRAALETDPAMKKTPSQSRDAGTKRGLKTKGGGGSPGDVALRGEPPPSASFETPASSALAKLRAERLAAKAPAKKGKRSPFQGPGVPPDFALAGRTRPLLTTSPLFFLSGALR